MGKSPFFHGVMGKSPFVDPFFMAKSTFSHICPFIDGFSMITISINHPFSIGKCDFSSIFHVDFVLKGLGGTHRGQRLLIILQETEHPKKSRQNHGTRPGKLENILDIWIYYGILMVYYWITISPY